MRRLILQNFNKPETYDEYFRKYEELQHDIPESEIERGKEMSKYVVNGMRVVELGCGISPLLLRIKTLFPDCEVHGLDFAPKTIKRLKEKYPDIEYKVGNALTTGYLDDYFDYVMAGELLEHIEDPRELVKEMARICKVGGFLAIHTPFKETEWNKNIVIPPEHIWEFGRDDIMDLFSPYGNPGMKFLIHQKGIHIIAVTKLCQK